MARVWVSWLLSPGYWESRIVRGVANEPTYSRSLMIRNKTAPPQTKQQTTKRYPFPYLFWDHLILMIIMKTSRSSVCMDSHPTNRLRKISLLSVKHRALYSLWVGLRWRRHTTHLGLLLNSRGCVLAFTIQLHGNVGRGLAIPIFSLSPCEVTVARRQDIEVCFA